MTGFAETPDDDPTLWLEVATPEDLAAHVAQLREGFRLDAVQKIRELILETGAPAYMQAIAEAKLMQHFDAMQAGGAAMLERLLTRAPNH